MEGFASSFANDRTDQDGVSAPTVLTWLSTGPVGLPQGADFLSADFQRAGPDLLIETTDGGAFLVPGYFMEETPPALETAGGSVLNAKLVTALAGPAAPMQTAQIGIDGQGAPGAAQTGVAEGAPIGQVSDLEGTVNVTRVDGTQIQLTTGASIFQGDVIETGPQGSIGVVFVDDTVFTLDEGGRMVIDEMVYDPGTQSGVFNAQVVQGVFSFVSGKTAKDTPDSMVVSTPTNTIGVRGSTLLGRAGPEGSENQFTLVPDIDGNVGEIIVSNAAGSTVLNQSGATTSVFSFNAPPPPPIILPPQQIQQNFGANLTKLVRVVAVKAEQDAQRARQEADERTQDAQQTEEEARQTEEEARQSEEESQQAEEEAAQLEEEAQAELAEAEALGDEEAIAAAQAKAAQAAALRAEAETKAAEAARLQAEAEAKAAEAAQKAAEAQAAQQQAEQAQQFQGQAQQAFTQQQQTFEQFVPQPGPGDQPPPDGPLPPGTPPPPDGQAPTADQAATAEQTGPTPEEQAAMDAEIQQAYQDAIAAGATPEEAFNAAAMLASDGNMDDPAVDIARAAFEEALAAGLSPEDAMFAAQDAVAQFDFEQNQFDTFQTTTDPYDPYDPFQTFTAYDAMMDPYAGTTDPYMDPYYDPYMDPYYDPYMDPYFDPYMDAYFDLYGMYDQYMFDPYMYDFDFFYDPYTDTNLTFYFGETIVAPSGGGSLSGSSLNTNYYFHWGSINSGASYSITDAGGTNQIAFDNMNNVTAKVYFGTSTSGKITIYGDSFVTSGTYATVTFKNIHQFLLSDVTVSTFDDVNYTDSAGGDVLVLPTMNGGETGYVAAGSSADDTFTIDTSHYPDLADGIFFGKGGGDTFNIDADVVQGYLTMIGGITSKDNVDTNSDSIPDQYMNVFDYSATTAALKIGIKSDGDIYVTDVAQSNDFSHEIWDAAQFKSGSGNDEFAIAGGKFNFVDGGDGSDVFNLSGGSFKTLSGGADTGATLDDTFVIKGNVTIADLQGDGGGTGGADVYKYTTSNVGVIAITDFTTTEDTLTFSRAAFNGDADTNGSLDVALETSATSGDKSSTGSSYFVYNSADGILYYDADADGSGTGVKIAEIDTVATGDFAFTA